MSDPDPDEVAGIQSEDDYERASEEAKKAVKGGEKVADESYASVDDLLGDDDEVA